MSESISIRKATQKDAQRLVQLSMELADIHFAIDHLYMSGQERKRELQSFYRKAVAGNNKYFVLVAEQENIVIGCVTGYTEPAREGIHTSRVGHIGGLYVIPSARNMGVGTSLVKTLLSWFRGKNIKIVEAYADVRNASSQKVLDKSSFEDWQTLKVVRLKEQHFK